MSVPGFWDGDESWRVRFTPSQVGDWEYSLVVADGRGESEGMNGRFTVTPSE